MAKKNFNISLNTYLPYLLQGLEEDGVEIYKFLNHRHLKDLDLYDSDNYIPNILLNNLMESIHYDIGVESIVATLPQHFKATEMGRYSARIFQSPNFLSFLESVIQYQNIVRTNNTGKLEILGSTAKFSVLIDEPATKGKLIAEEIGLTRILDAFRLIGGQAYKPLELGITAKKVSSLERILPKGSYKIHVDQPENWVIFETAMLSRKVPNLIPKVNSPEIISPQLTTFKVEKLFDSFLPDVHPGLEIISEMLNESTRSIQRRLKREGTSFLKIRERSVQLKAFELVANTDLSIKEISDQLNYTLSQNFIRSFKKWTGISPMEYREKL